MKLVKNKSGQYSVKYTGQDGKEKSTALGVTQLSEAKSIVSELKIAEMEKAAKLQLLSQEVVAKLTGASNHNFIDVLREYKQHRQRVASSPNTINTIMAIYYQFSRDYKYDKRSISEVSEKDLHDFINRDDGTSLSNKKLRLTSLSSLFKYAVAKGYMQINPSSLVKVDMGKMTHKQKEVEKRRPFTQWEYEQVVSNAPYFFKQATILSYWTGLRLGDCCSLEWASITDKHITVWTTKRDKRVRIPLGHKLFGGQKVIQAIKSIEKEDEVYCFPQWHKVQTNSKTRSKTSVYFNRILKRLFIEGKSFHCLRHSFTTRLYKAGIMLEDIGKVVGHSSTKTTEGYIHKN